MDTFAWPKHCRGAVSLTFDDGLPSHLNTAMPIMEEYGVRGTFYVNPNARFLELGERWAAAYAKGHEVGNHTMTHPCSQNFAFISQFSRRSLEEYSLDEIEDEIVETNRALAEVIPEQDAVSFCYPCYQPFVGRGATRQSYVPVVLRHCVAGRGRGETPNDPLRCDLGYLWSFPCERMSGAQMIGMVEEAIETGRWTILTFHGIQEGHLTVGDRDFEVLCRHLSQHADRVWSPTVAEGAKHIMEAQVARDLA
jgi:peptidoglycan-N-acetylglucosamine deacetylase